MHSKARDGPGSLFDTLAFTTCAARSGTLRLYVRNVPAHVYDEVRLPDALLTLRVQASFVSDGVYKTLIVIICYLLQELQTPDWIKLFH